MTTHYFDVEIACKYGIEKSILLQNIHFWLEKNKANNQNFYDQRYWVYNSSQAFNKLFPYISFKKIQRCLKDLVDDGILLVGNYNKLSYDRTNWYSINYEKLPQKFYQNVQCQEQAIKTPKTQKNTDFLAYQAIGQNRPIDYPILSNRLSHFVQPIPDSKPDNKPDRYISKEISSSQNFDDEIPNPNIHDHNRPTTNGEHEQHQPQGNECDLVNDGFLTKPKTYGRVDINDFLGELKARVGVTAFVDGSKERQIASHCLRLIHDGLKGDCIPPLGVDEWNRRLNVMLADSFMASNCNKIRYIYNNIKGWKESAKPVDQQRKLHDEYLEKHNIPKNLANYAMMEVNDSFDMPYDKICWEYNYIPKQN